MTRKISHIAITLLLVILTMGFSVSKHYCHGTLVKVSLFAEYPVGCQDDGNACSMGGCCHDEHQVFQMHESYTTPVVYDSVQFFPVTLAMIDFLRPVVFQSISLDHFSLAGSPPPPDMLTALSNLQVFRL